MRELKFRVWDTSFKEYSSYHLCRARVIDINNFERFLFEQYTGFKDKNGKDIYEGDNLTDVVETDEGKVNSKQKVFWNSPTGSWHLDNSVNQDETSSAELWLELKDFQYEILFKDL